MNDNQWNRWDLVGFDTNTSHDAEIMTLIVLASLICAFCIAVMAIWAWVV